MQEEVENRAVTLVISATKLTGRLLKAAILKYLASRKEKRLQKARAAPEKPTGKQTVMRCFSVSVSKNASMIRANSLASISSSTVFWSAIQPSISAKAIV